MLPCDTTSTLRPAWSAGASSVSQSSWVRACVSARHSTAGTKKSRYRASANSACCSGESSCRGPGADAYSRRHAITWSTPYSSARCRLFWPQSSPECCSFRSGDLFSGTQHWSIDESIRHDERIARRRYDV